MPLGWDPEVGAHRTNSRCQLDEIRTLGICQGSASKPPPARGLRTFFLAPLQICASGMLVLMGRSLNMFPKLSRHTSMIASEHAQIGVPLLDIRDHLRVMLQPAR